MISNILHAATLRPLTVSCRLVTWLRTLLVLAALLHGTAALAQCVTAGAITTCTYNASSSLNLSANTALVSVQMQAWGGGGKGGNTLDSGTRGAGGGGGGGYASKTITSGLASSYTITVGAGATTTAAGGTSLVTLGGATQVSASGGGSVGTNQLGGGTGGTGLVGDTSATGGTGVTSSSNAGGKGGCAANTACLTTDGDGGAGGANNGNGTAGYAPGGGGGGAGRSPNATQNKTGGSGAAGRVIITYEERGVSVADNSITEGSSGSANLNFTVTMSATSASNVVVAYSLTDGTAAGGSSCSTAGVDFVNTGGSVTIPAGSTTATIAVPVCGDTIYEVAETFSVTLTGVSSGQAVVTSGAGTATGTINNNDNTLPTVSIAAASKSEGDSGTSTMSFTVTMNRPSAYATSVNYATSDGTATVANNDYVAASGTLTIPAGATSTTGTINVTINGDTTFEPDETFAVSLSSPVNATLASGASAANGTILNDDAPPFIAQYKMDEFGWNGTAGEVKDSSGNNFHGTAYLAQSGTTISARAFTDALGAATCNYGVFDEGSVTDSYISLSGVTGPAAEGLSITAWVRSTSAASQEQPIVIQDDNNDGWGFVLAANTGTGKLRLYNRNVTMSSPTNGSISLSGRGLDTTYTLNSNTWYFVAATVNETVTPKTVTIYVFDNNYATSTPLATATATYTGTFSAGSGSVLIGGRSSAAGYHFLGRMDEVGIYAGAHPLNTVQTTRASTRTCINGPDHYEVHLPSTSINCVPQTVTVKACANSTNPCSNLFTSGIGGQTATLTASAGTWASGTSNTATITFGTDGTATTTLKYPDAADGATSLVSLTGETLAAGQSRKCCDGGTCITANSCTTTFDKAGLLFSASAGGPTVTIPTQTAGTGSSTYYLRAIKSGTANAANPTAACEALLTGASSVDFAYECNNPTSCHTANLMSINGGAATTISRNTNGSVTSYQSVPMTFDAAGNAPFTLNYSDVGLLRLHARKVLNSATLSGTSNSFVVQPYGFVLAGQCEDGTAIDITASASVPSTRFCTAGKTFSVVTTAVINPNGGSATAAPNFGKEASPETLAFTWSANSGVTGSVTGGSPAFTGSGGVFGTSTSYGWSWSEVGVLKVVMTTTSGNYLSGGGNPTSTAYLGRFVPDRFDVTIVPQCGSFIYAGKSGAAGQPFTVGVTAMNALTPTASATTNYNTTTGFAKPITLSLSSGGSTGSLYIDSTALGTATAIPAANFISGGYGEAAYDAASGKISFVASSWPIAPTTIAIQASDGEASGTGSAGTATAYAGRLRVSNAFGSERFSLLTPAAVDYCTSVSSGSCQQWLVNTDEQCLSFATAGGPSGTLALSSNGSATGATTTARCGVSGTSCGTTDGYACNSATTGATARNGSLRLCLTAPTGATAGYADVSFMPPSYLQDGVQSGRATFGVYKPAGRARVIDRREVR